MTEITGTEELAKKVCELKDPEKTQLILDVIGNSNVLWLNSFIKAFEEKFQVSGAAFVPGIAIAGGGGGVSAETKEEEKTAFDVFIKDAGANKIQVIKAIRTIINIGLKEAKELTENPGKAPVKSGIPRDEAEKIAKELEASGAKVEIK